MKLLRDRDKKIIQALQIFRFMSRDQIANLFFADVKKPITSANFVLKRLRREKYIDAYVANQPYIYFPEPSILKKNSQKIKHYLAIVDFYIGVCKYEYPTIFEVEKRYSPGYVQPDIFMIWQGRLFFVEVQLSRYSSKVMKEKLNRYVNYFKSESWEHKKIKFDLNTSPVIWIISKNPYAIKNDNLQIIQTSSTDDLFSNNLI